MNKDITKIDWYYWPKRERSPFFLYFMYYGPTVNTFKEIGFNIKTNGSCNGQILTEKKELKEFGDRLWKVVEKKPGYLLKRYEEAYNKYQEDVKKWQKLASKDFNKTANEELLEEYLAYLNSILEYSKYVYIPISIESQLQEKASSIINNKFKTEIEKTNETVMTPVRNSIVIEERKSLLNLAISIKKGLNSEKIKKKISNHIENYSFLKEKGFFLDFFDEKYYLDRICESNDPEKELKRLESETKEKQKDMKKILRLLSEEDATIIKTINESIFFRTWRFGIVTQSSYYAREMFYEISKRIGLDNIEDSIYLLPDEIKNSLLGGYSNLKGVVNQRKMGFVYITLGEISPLVLQGKEAVNLFEKIKKKSSMNSEVSGRAAFRGYVTGKAVVIKDNDSLDKITYAEILIVHSTYPEMVRYFKKIKAIVAEEGGILSHPALISREMKIPCVIGAENATSIFNDGDYIEVDANKGIVRKIKK